MSGPTIFSRRKFLQQTGALSALSLAGSLDMMGLSSASAQAGSYKALVCLFMFGGNDSNSLLIPVTNYAAYNAVRPLATGVNVAQSLLTPLSPINTPGTTYALHPAFTATNSNPTLSTLFTPNRRFHALSSATCSAGRALSVSLAGAASHAFTSAGTIESNIGRRLSYAAAMSRSSVKSLRAESTSTACQPRAFSAWPDM